MTHQPTPSIIPDMKALLATLTVTALMANAGAQTVGTAFTDALLEPYGVAVVPTNNVAYLTDSAHGQVKAYDPSTGQLASLVDAGPFNFSPAGIVVARSGLVVADTVNHQIYEITFDGALYLLAGRYSRIQRRRRVTRTIQLSRGCRGGRIGQSVYCRLQEQCYSQNRSG